MATDRGALPRVAWLATIATIATTISCKPTVMPQAPPSEPTSFNGLRPPPGSTGSRQVVVGEMCPQGAGGRPAIAPLLVRTVGWSDNAIDVTSAVERGSAPRFGVFGTDGKLAGVFDTLGVVDVGLPQQVASGTYAGASPCTYEASANARPAPGAIATREEDPRCGAATAGCGLAAGELVHPDELPQTPQFTIGGACITGDQLAVDIDGDGKIESFPLSGALDGIRGPAAEWSAAPTSTAPCKPQFTLYDVKLAPEVDGGKAVDQKSVVLLDVLGVIDLDSDGRRELVIALRFPTVRTIVVYTSVGSPQRLELAGEAQSFPR